MNDDVPQVFH